MQTSTWCSLVGRPAGREIPAADRGRLARRGRDEPLDEVECGLRDLLPAVVDGQRVAAVGHLLDLGDARVALLPLVGGVGDRPGNRVVLPPVEDQQRAPIGVVSTFDSVQGLGRSGRSSGPSEPTTSSSTRRRRSWAETRRRRSHTPQANGVLPAAEISPEHSRKAKGSPPSLQEAPSPANPKAHRT